jgi:hypothetical protein
MTDDRPGTLSRLRRLLRGQRPPEKGGVAPVPQNPSRYGIGSLSVEPGPFDEPPPEPVELIGEIPWELRDDDPGADEKGVAGERAE